MRSSVDKEAVIERVEQVLDQVVRPLLRVHGGSCDLLSIEQGVVEIGFREACTGCKLRPFTLVGAIRPRLLSIPGVKEVRARGVGVSEHALRRFDALARRHPSEH